MKRIAILVLMGAFLAGGVAETAGAAPTSACPKNKFCVWAKPGYKGKRLIVEKGASNQISRQMDNKISSLKNNTNTTVWLYEKRNLLGDARCFYSGMKVPNLGEFADWASSSLVSNNSPPCV